MPPKAVYFRFQGSSLGRRQIPIRIYQFHTKDTVKRKKLVYPHFVFKDDPFSIEDTNKQGRILTGRFHIDKYLDV